MIMKIPAINGHCGHESSASSYLSDGSDVANGDDVDSPTSDGDFSEYLWMENEEEFDKQVMQQLEEEELMEQCMEAMLEDEQECRIIRNQLNAQAWSTGTNSDTASANSGSDLCQGLGNLSVQDELAQQSTLNPNAAEFIPQQRPSIPNPSSVSLLSKAS